MQVAIHTYPMYRIPIWKPQIFQVISLQIPTAMGWPWVEPNHWWPFDGRVSRVSIFPLELASFDRPRSSVGPYKKYVTYAHRNIHTIQKNTHIYRHNIYLCITIYNYVHTCDVVCTYGIYMHLHHIESANSLCLKAPPFASWRSCHRVERLKILDSNSLHSKEDSGMASGPTDWVKDLRKS